VQVIDGQVGCHAGGDLTNVVAAQYLGPAAGGQPQGASRGHVRWAMVASKGLKAAPDAGQQHGLSRLAQHVGGIVAG
jgi:hypothetical protein